jgi:ACS family glucarate transporter-like MFS transporter
MRDKTRLRLRWVMFSYVFTFAMLAYVQRSSVSVAAEDMLPALHLSVVQLGWLNAAFTTAYAIFQLPGGALGQKYGARPIFLAVGVTGLIATIGTPISAEPRFSSPYSPRSFCSESDRHLSFRRWPPSSNVGSRSDSLA